MLWAWPSRLRENRAELSPGHVCFRRRVLQLGSNLPAFSLRHSTRRCLRHEHSPGFGSCIVCKDCLGPREPGKGSASG